MKWGGTGSSVAQWEELGESGLHSDPGPVTGCVTLGSYLDFWSLSFLTWKAELIVLTQRTWLIVRAQQMVPPSPKRLEQKQIASQWVCTRLVGVAT